MTPSPALADLAAFAHEMFEEQHPGPWLAPLPIGYGKTTKFLLPFVVEAIQRDLSKSRGIIVALERREDVVKKAMEVNRLVKKKYPGSKDIAFALISHTFDGPYPCPPDCTPAKHWQYEKESRHYPILITTHSMVANRKGKKPFTKWNDGKRVMILFDEKPSVYWAFNNFTRKDLLQPDPQKPIRNFLSGLLTGESTWDRTSENGFDTFHKKSLPDMPLIILDGTGKGDAFYSSLGVRSIPTSPIVHPHWKHVILETWNTSIGKTTNLTGALGKAMVKDILRILNETPQGKVFVVGHKAHRPSFETALRPRFPDRLVFAHYNAVKGSNDFNDTMAVVCVSTLFKPSSYYRLSGSEQKADIVKEFIQQTIGRTALRNNASCTIRVLIPWADEQGIQLLTDEMKRQWGAKVSHRVLQRKPIRKSRCQFLAKLKDTMKPGEIVERVELASRLKLSLRQISYSLFDNRPLLKSEGFTYTNTDVYRLPAIALTRAA